jgi:hypothetical protein
VKRQRARHRRRWEDNIEKDFKEMGCKVVDWIKLPQGRTKWWLLLKQSNSGSRTVKPGEVVDHVWD